MTDEIPGFQEQIDELREKVGTLRDEVDRLLESDLSHMPREQLETRFDAIAEQLQGLQDRFDGLEKGYEKVLEVSANLSKLREDAMAWSHRIDTGSKKVQAAVKIIEAVRKDIKHDRDSHGRTISAQNQKLDQVLRAVKGKK